MKRRHIFSLVLAFALTFMVRALALGCSVCLDGADGHDPLTDAFNWSVLFLMAMPYAIVAAIAGWIFYRHRSARKQEMLEKKTPVLHLAWNDKESGR